MTVFARLDAEVLCLRQFTRSSLRHVRYFRVFLFLVAYAFVRPARARTLRYGFCALQWIDDLLDGDLACEREPLEVIGELRGAVVNGRFGRAPEMRLTRALVEALDSSPVRDEAHAELLALIDVMMRDRERSKDGLLLGSAELRDHHRRTFTHSLNLTLIAVESSLRAGDVGPTPDLLGWCSTIRDFDEDLPRRLVNVPREAAISEPGMDLLAKPAVREWLRGYRAEAAQWMRECERAMAERASVPGIVVFRILVGSTRKYLC